MELTIDATYDRYQESLPILKEMFVSLAKNMNVYDYIKSIFIGKNSYWHKKRAKESGQVFKGLPYEDSYIIIVETFSNGAIQQTLANAEGIKYGINVPTMLSIKTIIKIYDKILEVTNNANKCENTSN